MQSLINVLITGAGTLILALFGFILNGFSKRIEHCERQNEISIDSLARIETKLNTICLLREK